MLPLPPTGWSDELPRVPRLASLCVSGPHGGTERPSPGPPARDAILPLAGTRKVLKVKVLPSALLLPNYDRQIENQLSKCQRTTNQHAKRVAALCGV